jgi:hypothetical protein
MKSISSFSALSGAFVITWGHILLTEARGESIRSDVFQRLKETITAACLK